MPRHFSVRRYKPEERPVTNFQPQQAGLQQSQQMQQSGMSLGMQQQQGQYACGRRM